MATINLTAGNDSVWIQDAPPSGNIVYALDGDDFVRVETNGVYDEVYGGLGNDSLYGSNDNLYGGAGNDYINVNGQLGVAYGGAGADTIQGFSGTTLIGDAGDDLIVLNNTAANLSAFASGGTGNDTVSLINGEDNVTDVVLGTGADLLRFGPVTSAHADAGVGTRVIVRDFNATLDRIDVAITTNWAASYDAGLDAVLLSNTDSARGYDSVIQLNGLTPADVGSLDFLI